MKEVVDWNLLEKEPERTQMHHGTKISHTGHTHMHYTPEGPETGQAAKTEMTIVSCDSAACPP